MPIASDWVRVGMFGRDHWSTLAYMETVMVDCHGFQVGNDPRMRSNRRNYRVMREQCYAPKRTGVPPRECGVVMAPEHGSRLNDGTVVDGHDDWSCVQDMAKAGLLLVEEGSAWSLADPEDIEPGVVVRLSARGMEIATALRAHKTSGGSFGNFAVAGRIDADLGSMKGLGESPALLTDAGMVRSADGFLGDDESLGAQR